MITETQALIEKLRKTATDLKIHTTLHSVANLLNEAADKIEALAGGMELSHLDPGMYERIFTSIGDVVGPKYAPTVRQAIFNQIVAITQEEVYVKV